MAKQQKKKVSRIKVKKKIWYPILSPRVFGMKEIGETYRSSADSALGRVMKISLRDLTGNVRNQNVDIHFKLAKAEGSTLHTIIVGYTLTPAYLKRVTRKNTARLDDRFILKTKDGQKVIIKSLMISLHRIQRSVKTKLRKQLQALLKEELSKTDFTTFIGNIVYKNLGMDLKKKLNKVYPLKEVSFRVIKLTGKTKETHLEVKKPVEKAVKKEAPKVEKKKEEVKEPKEESPKKE